VDCALQVLKEHCYWPLVSDLNNVLSHRPVALRFMEDDKLLESWFAFLSMFQGMNVNQRETSQHIEFEPSTYYASFSAELEASAYPMWALVSHLNDASMLPYTKRVISRCLQALNSWLDYINFKCPINVSRPASTDELGLLSRQDGRSRFESMWFLFLTWEALLKLLRIRKFTNR